jgi:predicted nucleic acid-binding protein
MPACNSSKSVSQAQRFTTMMLGFLEVATTGTTEAIQAEQMGLNDLEDAMQIVAAAACAADVIVTRNVGDFSTSPIPVLTPREFLAKFIGSPVP